VVPGDGRQDAWAVREEIVLFQKRRIMLLSDLLSNQPPVKIIPGARQQVGNTLAISGKRLVVIDDDPTGMQAVQDVNVYMDWSVATLRKALIAGTRVFFISINSRSLNPGDAKALALEVGHNLKQAVDMEQVSVLLASRSDSTLRGHFPYEVDALVSGFGVKPDGLIFVPALLEAGRYTIDDIQWAEQAGQVVPVHETEFARDPVFQFTQSNLKAWIEEKTNGETKASGVLSISLGLLRGGGPVEVARQLMVAANGVPVIVNAADYSDLDIFSLALQLAEDQGKTFFYRCSASFLKARGGFPDSPLLTHRELLMEKGPGLIVTGSYVDKTTRQLKRVFDAGLAAKVELHIERLMVRDTRQTEIDRTLAEIDRDLAEGMSVVLYTSRRLRVSPDEDFTATGKSIMGAVCEVIRRLETRPAYLVAKGGVTSIEIARTALNVNEALALGQILPGVPVWRLGTGARWPGLTYIVFPGNVGDDSALVNAVSVLNS
jgi:uncharacterized protein YgbK (DUF1537 family)